MHVKRIIFLVVLLAAGAGTLLYGSLFHCITVEVDKQREISIAVPNGMMAEGMPAGPQEFGGKGEMTPGGQPAENMPEPPPQPGMKLETVYETYVESQQDREGTIVREITFGGVERLANGLLKRTYSGKPPALCPT